MVNALPTFNSLMYTLRYHARHTKALPPSWQAHGAVGNAEQAPSAGQQRGQWSFRVHGTTYIHIYEVLRMGPGNPPSSLLETSASTTSINRRCSPCMIIIRNAGVLGTSHRIMRRGARQPRTCSTPFVAAISRSDGHDRSNIRGRKQCRLLKVRHVCMHTFYVVGEKRVFGHQQPPNLAERGPRHDEARGGGGRDYLCPEKKSTRLLQPGHYIYKLLVRYSTASAYGEQAPFDECRQRKGTLQGKTVTLPLNPNSDTKHI